MGMARSKLRADRKRIEDNREAIYTENFDLKNSFLKMSNTIKHLKHSLAFKDNQIKEMESIVKNYKESYKDLLDLSKEYSLYMEYLLNLNRQSYDIVKNSMNKTLDKIHGLTRLAARSEDQVSILLNKINNYEKKIR